MRQDERFRAAVERTGRRKLLMAGLWTEVCIVMPVLQALEDGYEVYVVADACDGTSIMAHEMAMDRMIQAGVVPVTWMQVLLDWCGQSGHRGARGCFRRRHAVRPGSELDWDEGSGQGVRRGPRDSCCRLTTADSGPRMGVLGTVAWERTPCVLSNC